jgi:hypothetical protein
MPVCISASDEAYMRQCATSHAPEANMPRQAYHSVFLHEPNQQLIGMTPPALVL